MSESHALKSPAGYLAAAMAVAILLLGLRAYIDPVAASAGFGLPMHGDAETTFVRIYGARNALLGAVALGFIMLRMIKPLALLFTMATVLPLLDALVLTSKLGISRELIRHAVILVVLLTASIALWRLDGREAIPPRAR